MRKHLVRLSVAFTATVLFVGSSGAADSVPEIAGQWGRDMLFFEPPGSGPGPILNMIRRPDGTRNKNAPCCAIVVEGGWVGDDTNPILRPEAANAVKKYRELADSGTVVSDLHNTCRPEPPPFAMSLQFGVNIVQQKNDVMLFYLLYNTVRHVRMNASHPKNIAPSWQGDSIGRYEGDTLVVDTVGIKEAPYSTVDAFGTPHTNALHVVERYRLIDGQAAADAQKQNGAIFRPNPPYGRGTIDPDTAKKGLEVEFTVEDPAVFTTAWTGRVTYRRLIGDWPESVCAENPHFFGATVSVPTAAKPDF
ncbi:MAG TPA: hypothetical protein VEU06_00610 [Micropepsaceae bacterium]|nr:hypothetical protein [Micropepsaceae bacterium]